MGNYRNFELGVYFVAHGTQRTSGEQLEKELAFFQKYMRLDHVYLEPYRGGPLVEDARVQRCKQIFERHGIRVSGGLTTVVRPLEGENKQRMFDTACYNDPAMLRELQEASEALARHFNEYIIDDFYFTNCTCETCRAEKDRYNQLHGIKDGSWKAYRLDLMARISKEVIIGPAKKINPGMKIIIKYPNWAESYQDTGYNPKAQRDLFDGVYTGTETRDPLRQDQHLPRYLSFSLMTYFEAMCPGKNGGGWFDPFDLYSLDQYLEQAYLTAFSKPRELMMFCFQALANQPEIPALGYHLDRLDDLLDHLGKPVGIPCYLPDNSHGEDNVQDYLGMNGIPILLTPYFPEDAKTVLLTAASAEDPCIMEKLEAFVASGGTAIVTSGFSRLMEKRGLRALSSVSFEGRRAEASGFMVERLPGSGGVRMDDIQGREAVGFPVAEFRNNFTWALVKYVDREESFGMLLKDTYGKGKLLTLIPPDVYSRIRLLPREVLTRIRAEMAVDGVYMDGKEGISLFVYDNHTLVLYPYVQEGMEPADVEIHLSGKAELTDLQTGQIIPPFRRTERETVFRVFTRPGKYRAYKYQRTE